MLCYWRQRIKILIKAKECERIWSGVAGWLLDNRKCWVTVSEWVRGIKPRTRGYLRTASECRLVTLVSIRACRRQLAPAPRSWWEDPVSQSSSIFLWDQLRDRREQLLAPRMPWRSRSVASVTWSAGSDSAPRPLPCQFVIDSVTSIIIIITRVTTHPPPPAWPLGLTCNTHKPRPQ